MANLHRLESIEIKGFRTFSNLDIPNLCDVNLIVGRNNLGKTSLLEALELYFSQGDRSKIVDLLVSREEYRPNVRGLKPRDISLSIESLFYGRPQLSNGHPRFRISSGPDGNRELSVEFVWLQEIKDDDEALIRYKAIRGSNIEASSDATPGIRIKFGVRSFLVPLSRLDRPASFSRRLVEASSHIPVAYLNSTGMSVEEVGRIWDIIALTDDEDRIMQALQSIFPLVEKLVLVQGYSPRAQDRIMMAKIRNQPNPVPFKSLGEGINHLLGVFLALVKSKGGVLLADEIENGIHYSVQDRLWELIFKQAAQWNIQVFATTHSWDCVEGFQVAALSQDRLQARLFRLEGDHHRIKAVSFEPKEIEIARRENIEVR